MYTISQAIETYSKATNAQYKVVGDKVMRKLHFEKRFSFDSKKEDFLNDFIEMQRTIIANENCKKTVEFLETLGLTPDYKSVFGAKYFFTEKGKIRVSNHHYTSEKHNEPDFNFCSYEKNGYIEIIESLKKILK
jgi:ribosomal protein L4